MKLTMKRYETLARIREAGMVWWDDTVFLIWESGDYVSLYASTCHWLIRNKLVSYDVAYNDEVETSKECRIGIGFRITDVGISALRLNGPKAVVLPFRKKDAA